MPPNDIEIEVDPATVRQLGAEIADATRRQGLAIIQWVAAVDALRGNDRILTRIASEGTPEWLADAMIAHLDEIAADDDEDEEEDA